ncbi:hypothetical protein XELAEV_18022293mg [Xenopus laevis]|uniref:Secreted protein n=1 Tax=Xenopus laevis TaxID=8355 RepID=A0A974HN19_XENLA|nr:hypothetical protein XELAEV_18022293mg [Xenopus laevis]
MAFCWVLVHKSLLIYHISSLICQLLRNHSSAHLPNNMAQLHNIAVTLTSSVNLYNAKIMLYLKRCNMKYSLYDSC